jgi:hypothetical protein
MLILIKIKKEEKDGYSNILAAVAVSGTHVGIAGTTTQRTVVMGC